MLRDSTFRWVIGITLWSMLGGPALAPLLWHLPKKTAAKDPPARTSVARTRTQAPVRWRLVRVD